MANFVAILDLQPERRKLFVEQIARHIGFLDGLRAGSVSSGDFTAVWAAATGTPITEHTNGQDSAVVWGEPWTEGTSELVDAKTLLSRWNGSGCPSIFDGFYAAISYSAGELIAGADRLGLFPVYYYEGP